LPGLGEALRLVGVPNTFSSRLVTTGKSGGPRILDAVATARRDRVAGICQDPVSFMGNAADFCRVGVMPPGRLLAPGRAIQVYTPPDTARS
jgi:hypothetical protein